MSRRRGRGWLGRVAWLGAGVAGRLALPSVLPRVTDQLTEQTAKARIASMEPALRARAAAVAGGPVHEASHRTTPTETRFVYRRGRCRIVIRVDRAHPPSAAKAPLHAGQACR